MLGTVIVEYWTFPWAEFSELPMLNAKEPLTWKALVQVSCWPFSTHHNPHSGTCFHKLLMSGHLIMPLGEIISLHNLLCDPSAETSQISQCFHEKVGDAQVSLLKIYIRDLRDHESMWSEYGIEQILPSIFVGLVLTICPSIKCECSLISLNVPTLIIFETMSILLILLVLQLHLILRCNYWIFPSDCTQFWVVFCMFCVLNSVHSLHNAWPQGHQ